MKPYLNGVWLRGIVLAIFVLGISMALPGLAQDTQTPPPAEGEVTGETAIDEAAGAVPESMDEAIDAEEGTGEEAAPADAAERKSTSGVLELFDAGGMFMWPLLVTSIIGLAVILERIFTLQRAHTNTRNLMEKILQNLKGSGIAAAIEACTRTRGPIAAVLHAGLLKAPKGPAAVEKAIEDAGTIEMAFLQRGLIWLATVANVAPLIGFLGTVSGMINAFEAIAAAEQVSAKVVAKGISEALITTATGLLIAIPVQTAHNYFVARIDRFVLEMEESSVELVEAISEGVGQQ